MANGSINKFTDKIFPAIALGNQTANNNLKTLPPPPANESQANTALNHVTGQVAARQNSASQTTAVKGAGGDDTPKTATDFLREIRSRQPFDEAALAKKKTSVELKLSKPPEKLSVADYDAAAWKAIFKEAGYSILTDKEVRIAVQAMKNIGWTAADNGFALSNLRKARSPDRCSSKQTKR